MKNVSSPFPVNTATSITLPSILSANSLIEGSEGIYSTTRRRKC